MTDQELESLKKIGVVYVAKVNDYFNSSFPGLTINDPVMVLVRLMASKNPNSLIKALLLSDNVGKLKRRDKQGKIYNRDK
jgi:hypothetical protein